MAFNLESTTESGLGFYVKDLVVPKASFTSTDRYKYKMVSKDGLVTADVSCRTLNQWKSTLMSPKIPGFGCVRLHRRRALSKKIDC